MNSTVYTVKVYENRTEWFNEKGQFHRPDGPAREYANGSKCWYVEGKLHRLDGPAVERANGSKFWFVEGKLHRLDGPAREWASGYKAWYVEDKQLTEEEFNSRNSCVNKVVIIDGQEYQLVLKR